MYKKYKLFFYVDIIKMLKKYNCKCCDYSTGILYNWNKHLKTKKHLKKNKTISEDPIRSSKLHSTKIRNK